MRHAHEELAALSLDNICNEFPELPRSVIAKLIGGLIKEGLCKTARIGDKTAYCITESGISLRSRKDWVGGDDYV